MLATADCVSNCHVDGKRLHLKYTTTKNNNNYNTFQKTSGYVEYTVYWQT